MILLFQQVTLLALLNTSLYLRAVLRSDFVLNPWVVCAVRLVAVGVAVGTLITGGCYINTSIARHFVFLTSNYCSLIG